MKEAFWGILVVSLGLFGIVVVNTFQKVTVDNDRVYYVLKESTESSMYDALDLGFYRTHGTYRIVEEKFIESLTKRFANSITVGNYKIIVANVNELPALASVYVNSSITTINNESFTLKNGVNGIIETKYNEDEVISFLGITKNEWDKLTKETTDYCSNSVTDEEIKCITGDIRFDGWGSITGEDAIENGYTCKLSDLSPATITANYSICKCNKWETQESISITSTPKNGVYTFRFQKTSENNIASIDVTREEVIKEDVCATGLNLYGNRDRNTNFKAVYGDCSSGVWIKNNDTISILPNYTPSNSIDRELNWNTTEINNYSNISAINKNPTNACIRLKLKGDGSNCKAELVVTTKDTNVKTNDTITVSANTNSNVTNTCKLKFDNDTPTCSVSVGTSGVTVSYKDNTSGIVRVGIGNSYDNARNNVVSVNQEKNGNYTKAVSFTGIQYAVAIDAAGNETTCQSQKAVTSTESYVCGSGCYSVKCGCTYIWSISYWYCHYCTECYTTDCTRCNSGTKLNESYCY